MKKILLCIIFAFACPVIVFAQESDIEISPFIIDEKAKAGDILKYEVLIKNNSENKVNLYAVVNDILKTEGDVEFQDPAELDRDISISRWMSFKRGVIELSAGASIAVPLEINISSSAVPGKRFARIALPNGSNRPLAEEGMATKSFVQLPINIEIVEDIIEKVQIKEFTALKRVFVSPPFGFTVKLENNGNKEVKPRGNIYIYNRRGEELNALAVNPDSDIIPTEENWDKSISWQELRGMGKYKARLEIEYGEKDKRDLQDTLYFWYFPWKFLLIVFFGTFLLLAIIVTLIFRKTYIHQHSPQISNVQIRQAGAPSKDIVNLKK